MAGGNKRTIDKGKLCRIDGTCLRRYRNYRRREGTPSGHGLEVSRWRKNQQRKVTRANSASNSSNRGNVSLKILSKINPCNVHNDLNPMLTALT